MSYCSPPSSENFIYKYLDENTLFSCITTLTFAVIGIFLYILSAYTFFEKQNIPRATRPTAPYGNIKDVVFQNTTLYIYLWKYYNRLKRKGYKLAGFYLFLKPSVLVINPSLQYKILVESVHFTDIYRDKFVENYKEITKLFSDDITESVLKRFKELKDGLFNDLRDNSPINEVVEDFFLKLTSLIFGFNIDYTLLREIIREKTTSNLHHYFSIIYPYFKRNFDATTNSLLDADILHRKKNDIVENDVLQRLISNATSDSKKVKREVFELFIENIIFSSSSLLLCLYELAKNEDVQEDLIGEIRRCKKDNPSINLDNLHGLVYLDAVIKETLRKYPPVPLVTKKCNKDYNSKETGIKLLKNTFLFATILGIHHDSANYPDPESFDPDRFYEDNRKFIKHNTYLPFGFSPRKEIGFFCTVFNLKLALISILSSFKVNLTKKDYVMEFDNKKLNICPKEPLCINFELLQ